MASAKAKTINLLLYDGTLSGVISIADSAWTPGEMYAAPRDSVEDLIKTEACDKYGVYLLLSENRVYVGQAQDLSRRIKQHLSGKDWWDRVILLTTESDSFTHSDIDYLEAYLIEQARSRGTLDVDNLKAGNKPKVTKFQKVALDQYLDEAMLLLELIGVTVFQKKSRKKGRAVTIIAPPMKDQDPVTGGIQRKPELPDMSLPVGKFVKQAMQNLQDSGYQLRKEDLDAACSIEGSREYTKRNLPLFWVLEDGETRQMCDKGVRDRYWKEEFVLNGRRFLMYSQWYPKGRNGAQRTHFERWYESI